MKRATMVTLSVRNLTKVRERNENLSNLIDILLTKYLAESELNEEFVSALPRNMTEQDFANNVNKSSKAWENYKKEKEDSKVIGD